MEEDIESGLEHLTTKTLVMTLSAVKEELKKRGFNLEVDEESGLDYEENKFFIQKRQSYEDKKENK